MDSSFVLALQEALPSLNVNATSATWSPRYGTGRSNRTTPSADVSPGHTITYPGGTFVMNSPSCTSCAWTMPESDCAGRPFNSETNRVPFDALTSTSASFERRAVSFFPFREIALKSTELARRIMSRHASNSKPYDRARSRLTYPKRTRAPRSPARSARRYQSELYDVAAWDFSIFLRYRAMSAGPGKKTYASAFDSAAHSGAETCPSFVDGRFSTDRQ